jgi:hypothetical protein
MCSLSLSSGSLRGQCLGGADDPFLMVLAKVAPYVLIWLAFTLMYLVMPIPGCAGRCLAVRSADGYGVPVVAMVLY